MKTKLFKADFVPLRRPDSEPVDPLLRAQKHKEIMALVRQAA
jgi:hypothetical protein